MKTGNTCPAAASPLGRGKASMEPGHEDREYTEIHRYDAVMIEPQWSPVMKTGNTGVSLWESQTTDMPQWSPVMKTGNTPLEAEQTRRRYRLNGARS